MVAIRLMRSFLVEESEKSPRGDDPEPDMLKAGSFRHNSISC